MHKQWRGRVPISGVKNTQNVRRRPVCFGIIVFTIIVISRRRRRFLSDRPPRRSLWRAVQAGTRVFARACVRVCVCVCVWRWRKLIAKGMTTMVANSTPRPRPQKPRTPRSTISPTIPRNWLFPSALVKPSGHRYGGRGRAQRSWYAYKGISSDSDEARGKRWETRKYKKKKKTLPQKTRRRSGRRRAGVDDSNSAPTLLSLCVRLFFSPVSSRPSFAGRALPPAVVGRTNNGRRNTRTHKRARTRIHV